MLTLESSFKGKDTDSGSLELETEQPAEDEYHNRKKTRRDTLKNLCIKTKPFPLETLGNEKTNVDTGAATRVSIKDPTKSSGRFDKPKDIAPSSRNGRTTKYALKMKKKQEDE